MRDQVNTIPTLDTIREYRSEILAFAKQYRAYQVRIFGSVARGEAHIDSDVDFLVDFEAGYSLLDQAGLLVDLRDLLGRPVDVVNAAMLRDEYRPYILRDAVQL